MPSDGTQHTKECTRLTHTRSVTYGHLLVLKCCTALIEDMKMYVDGSEFMSTEPLPHGNLYSSISFVLILFVITDIFVGLLSQALVRYESFSEPTGFSLTHF